MRLQLPGFRTAAFLAFAGVVTACGSNEPPPPPPPPPAAPAQASAPTPPAPADNGAAERARLEAERRRATLEQMVYFDYDDASIRDDARATLNEKAQILRDDPSITIRIAGHADERGSTEYNLALGHRRATSIRDFLAGFGITAGRFETTSFGEERPLAQGSGETAWSRNRRGEFTITGGPSAGR